MMTQTKMDKGMDRAAIYNKIKMTKHRPNSVVGAALKAALLGKKMKGSNKVPKKIKSVLNDNIKKIQKPTLKHNLSKLSKDKSLAEMDLGEALNGIEDIDERTIVGLKYILNNIDLSLEEDTKNSLKKVNKVLKNFKTLNDFEMRNGIYSAVVKDIDMRKAVVSIGNIVSKDKTIGNNGVVSVDYFIDSRGIDGSLDLGDELFVSLSLNNETGRFDINEFKLTIGEKYFMTIDNVTKKGVFIKTGIYSTFISDDILKRAGYDNKLQKGDQLLVNLKSIKDDKKDANKKWLNVSLVSKAYKGKNFPTFDFVKNRESLDRSFYKVEEQKKKINKQTKSKTNSKKPQTKQVKNKKVENKKTGKSNTEAKKVEGKDINILAA